MPNAHHHEKVSSCISLAWEKIRIQNLKHGFYGGMYYFHIIKLKIARRWCMLLIPAHRKADICEFEASLVYIVSSRIANFKERNPVS